MKKIFKYTVIVVILCIPFIYSFFYLKAYWNPYGSGNIDNIPVAVINSDSGDKGDNLVEGIKDSGKLKLTVLSKEEAESGLYDGKYYAIINIPQSFSEDLNSVSDNVHPTITYMPNQKSNFLASQIINSVLNAVEKNLDNEVNSAIVDNLSDNIESLPDKLSSVSDGFSKLKDGTGRLYSGSSALYNGVNSLNSRFGEFNNGLSSLRDGINKLSSGSFKLSDGIKSASDGTGQIKSVLDNKISELQGDTSNALTDEQIESIGVMARDKVILNEENIKNAALASLSENANYQEVVSQINMIETNYINMGITSIDMCVYTPDVSACEKALTSYPYLKTIKEVMEETVKSATYNASLSTSYEVSKATALTVGNMVKEGFVKSSISSLSELADNLGKLNNGLNDLYGGSLELSSGIHELFDGSGRLYSASILIKSGIGSLDDGAFSLNNGVSTLDSSVMFAKDEVDSNIQSTKNEIKRLENLSEYSKEPVKVKTKAVNKVESYGTAFSPLFMSIGLWIGCLMMFMVLYYDKEERFGIFGNNSNENVKQVLMYHGLITVSSIVLGMLLHILLGFNVSNIFVYYLSLVLVGNMFMGIIEFLIMTFSDFGKFIALILLVLQLAASGGTFPIETVTKGFRWLHDYLPMTYTINLFKESLMGITDKLLADNLIVVVAFMIFFFALNILLAKFRQNKLEV